MENSNELKSLARELFDIVLLNVKSWRVFDARTSRKDFWVTFVALILSIWIAPLVGPVLLCGVFPSLVTRRLHDAGFRGWAFFFPGSFIVWGFLSETEFSVKKWPLLTGSIDD